MDFKLAPLAGLARFNAGLLRRENDGKEKWRVP